MAFSDLDPSTRILGICSCFVLIAYIFHHLGNNSHSPPTNPPREIPQTTQAPVPELSPDTSPVPALRSPHYEDGFKDGTQASLLFDINDMKREVEKRKHEYRERERKAEAMLKEVNKKAKAMNQSIENWIQETRVQRKGRLEEQFRVSWEDKPVAEKGVRGWFGLGKRNGAKEKVGDANRELEKQR